MLDRALKEAGITRDKVYITHAVKHFKWKPAGKRKLHQRPTSAEVRACRPWLEAEIQLLLPDAIVCMGSLAAEAIFGRKVPVLAQRGQWIETSWSDRTLITVHPSAILRIPDRAERHEQFGKFVADLKLVAKNFEIKSRKRKKLHETSESS